MTRTTADKRGTARHAAPKQKPTMRHAPKDGAVADGRPSGKSRDGGASRFREDKSRRASLKRRAGGEDGRLDMGDFGFSPKAGAVANVVVGLAMAAMLGYCIYLFLVG